MLFLCALTTFGLGFWLGWRVATVRPRMRATHEWEAYGQRPLRRAPAPSIPKGIARPPPAPVARDSADPTGPGRIYLHSAS